MSSLGRRQPRSPAAAADVVESAMRMLHACPMFDNDLAYLVYLLLMTSSLAAAAPSKGDNNTAAALARKLLRGYEKLPPPNGPTVVQLGIYINYIYDINEQTMDYKLSFYLRRNWTDSRLTFDVTENGNNPRLKLDMVDLERLWIPDVFMSNEKGASSHKVTTLNQLMYLTNTGIIWFVSKISTTLACHMKLQKYPMDTQECPIKFQSFGYPLDTVEYRWLPDGKALQFDSTVWTSLPEMTIIGNYTEVCELNDTEANPPGLYPCLEAKFTVKRKLGYFFIQFYFPSVLLVIMSWVSFWISSDAVVARVSIGLLTILNLVTQSTGSRNQLPKVSYIKAIDVWNTTCLIFAFASLIEFATVNVWSRTDSRRPGQSPPPPGSPASPASSASRASPVSPVSLVSPASPVSPASSSRTLLGVRRKNEDIPLRRTTTKGGSEPSPPPSPTPSARRTRGIGRLTSLVPPALPISGLSTHQHRAKTLDGLSRKVFPSLFVLFNIVYWLAYTL